MELAFAGLHQLCGPMLDHLDACRRRNVTRSDRVRHQCRAGAGPVPDRPGRSEPAVRRRRGAAARSAWSTTSSGSTMPRRRCSRSSPAAWERSRLAWSSRRGSGSRPGRAAAAAGHGPAEADARAAAGFGADRADRRAGPRSDRRRDAGNPLALLGVAAGTDAGRAGRRVRASRCGTARGQLEESFRRRVGPCPSQTRRLLLLAAADPGDPALVWRAAARSGSVPRGRPAAEAGLAEFGTESASAIPWRARRPTDRRRLGADGGAPAPWRRSPTRELDADRAPGTAPRPLPGPDEDVADELERSAGRAQARGGLAAAAAFLERAAMLTSTPRNGPRGRSPPRRRRSRPATFDAARTCWPWPKRAAHRIPAGPADLCARSSPSSRTAAAKRRRCAEGREDDWSRIDAGLSRATYLDADGRQRSSPAARQPGRRRLRGGTRGRGGASRARPAPGSPAGRLAAAYNDGYAAGVPTLRKALTDFSAGMSAERSCAGCGWRALPRCGSGTTTVGTAVRTAHPAGPRRPARSAIFPSP